MARLEALGIGNGKCAAHVAADGDAAWCFLPRFDDGDLPAVPLEAK